MIGVKKLGPSEDFYDCTFCKKTFQLCYDLDYGTSVYAEDIGVLESLCKSFR